MDLEKMYHAANKAREFAGNIESNRLVSASVWEACAEICERQDETNKLLRELALELRVMNNASVPR